MAVIMGVQGLGFRVPAYICVSPWSSSLLPWVGFCSGKSATHLPQGVPLTSRSEDATECQEFPGSNERPIRGSTKLIWIDRCVTNRIPAKLEQDHTHHKYTSLRPSPLTQMMTIQNLGATRKLMRAEIHARPYMCSPQTHATTGRIQYHTPAAAGPSLHETPSDKNVGETQDKLQTHTATQDPIRACPQLYATTGEIWYHTPTGAGVWYHLAPLHQNPPDKSTDEAPHVVPMCAAPENSEGPALCDVTTPAAAGVVISDYLYQCGRPGHPA
ncbi:hypothetical protein BS47DRAFT_1358696 [Hydnum rufescens UP504]|uniref:Uncharacterized protein n=1 Tax=Hydnum rufescens UP504 TaxID=1448309 RepID=A0A9P6B6L4_9AGAM|nr:hypothetical protein BS47DRAFT_1358696 [Hydnum rufescens UP504]